MKLENLDSSASDSFEVDIAAPEMASSEELGSEASNDVTNIDELDNGQGGFWDNSDVSNSSERSAQTDEDLVSNENPIEQESADLVESAMSIDINGKPVEFNLDPEDENLRRTLRNGVKAKKWKAELNSSKAEIKQMQESLAGAKEAQEVFNTMQEHMEDGNLDMIVQSLLGDQYKDYMNEKIEGFIKYQDASPEERNLMDQELKSKTLSNSERAKEKRIKELQDELDGNKESAQVSQLSGYATDALRKVEFSSEEIADKSLRHNLNKRLWKNSWDTIKDLDGKYEITSKLINKVFTREGKMLKSALGKQSNTVVHEKKKVLAKQSAAAVATKNHPKRSSMPKSAANWNGKSVHDLLNLMK